MEKLEMCWNSNDIFLPASHDHAERSVLDFHLVYPLNLANGIKFPNTVMNFFPH